MSTFSSVASASRTKFLVALALGTFFATGAYFLGEHAWAHQGSHEKSVKAPKVFESPPKVGTKATCPVTGEEFTVTKDTLRSEYKGKHVVFCCPGCKPKFDANPEKYMDHDCAQNPGNQYKCPMGR